jgi:hypothetical protein
MTYFTIYFTLPRYNIERHTKWLYLYIHTYTCYVHMYLHVWCDIQTIYVCTYKCIHMSRVYLCTWLGTTDGSFPHLLVGANPMYIHRFIACHVTSPVWTEKRLTSVYSWQWKTTNNDRTNYSSIILCRYIYLDAVIVELAPYVIISAT